MKLASSVNEAYFIFLGHYCAFFMQYYSLAKSLFFSFIFFLNKLVNS